jgi:transposase InsO family protein
LHGNALTETVNSLQMTDLTHNPGPWKNADDVAFATLPWVNLFNTVRFHETLDYVPPTKFAAAHNLQVTKTNQSIEIQ